MLRISFGDYKIGENGLRGFFSVEIDLILYLLTKEVTACTVMITQILYMIVY